MFKNIKIYYKKNLYTKEMVHKFVEKGFLTAEQYEDIIASKN